MKKKKTRGERITTITISFLGPSRGYFTTIVHHRPHGSRARWGGGRQTSGCTLRAASFGGVVGGCGRPTRPLPARKRDGGDRHAPRPPTARWLVSRRRPFRTVCGIIISRTVRVFARARLSASVRSFRYRRSLYTTEFTVEVWVCVCVCARVLCARTPNNFRGHTTNVRWVFFFISVFVFSCHVRPVTTVSRAAFFLFHSLLLSRRPRLRETPPPTTPPYRRRWRTVDDPPPPPPSARGRGCRCPFWCYCGPAPRAPITATRCATGSA